MILNNARIYDGANLLDGLWSVVIEGSLIREVGPALQTTNQEAVDLAGKTLMPGLISSHFHADFFKFSLKDGMDGHTLGKEMPPGVGMAIGVRNCGIALESGFTGLVSAGCANDIDAQLKISIAENIIRGPRMLACGHHLNVRGAANRPPKWWQDFRTAGIDLYGSGPEEMRALVRDEVVRGVEIVKIFGSPGHAIMGPKIRRNISKPELEAVVEAAHDLGVKVRAHVCERDRVLECIEAGVDVIDHGDEVDETCIDAMAKAGTFWVPSLTLSQVAKDLGLEGSGKEFSNGLERVCRMLPIAQRAGVRILIGDDYGSLFRDYLGKDDPLDHQIGNYGREFAFYKDRVDVSAEEILGWGTKNAGQLLVDAPQKVGVIEHGALADIIVVDGNPLVDLTMLSDPETNLKLVVVDGTVLIDRL